MSDYQDEPSDPLRDIIGGLLKRAKEEHEEAIREPIASYPVPEEHIEQLLTLAQAERQATTKLAELVASTALWRFVGEIMPGTKDYSCVIDTSKCLQPRIRLVDPVKRPCVGRDGVRDIVTIAGKQLDELHQHIVGDGPLDKYRLWKYLQTIDARVSSNDNWTVLLGSSCAYLLRKEEADD